MVLHGVHIQKMAALALSESSIFCLLRDAYTGPSEELVVSTNMAFKSLKSILGIIYYHHKFYLQKN
jgi:hypothetical protein